MLTVWTNWKGPAFQKVAKVLRLLGYFCTHAVCDVITMSVLNMTEKM